MKRILIIIFMIAVMIILGTIPAHATDASAELRVSNSTVKPGDTFKINLYATYEDGAAIVAADDSNCVYYSYDKSKLELINKYTPLTDFSALEKNDDGTEVEGFSLDGDFSSQSVYEWTFKVKENAELGDTQFSITPVWLMNNEECMAKGEAVATAGTKITVQPVTISISNNVTPTSDSTPNSMPTPSGDESKNNGQSGGSSSDLTSNGSQSGSTSSGTASSGSQSGSSTSGSPSKSGTSTTTSSGKTDSTTATTILPKTGFVAIAGTSLVALVILAIVMYKKIKKFDGIE